MAVFLLLFAFATAAFADVKTYPTEHFSIAIPDGWTEIPRAELQQLASNLRQAAPDAGAQSYDYGFRPANNAAHVRVLIQVKHERWPEEFLEETSKLPRAKGLIQHGVTATSASLAELQPKIGEMRWDPDRQVLWMRTQLAGEKSAMEILSAAQLTKEGSIQIHCSADGDEYEKVAATFSSVIDSLRIADDWKYEARGPFRRLFSDYVWVAVGVVGIASLIGAMFAGRKKLA